uniref:Glycosyltransferase n=1 Tax=Quercus lobata TaxID=97700 RepID=A0A7N2MG25_QUELO
MASVVASISSTSLFSPYTLARPKTHNPQPHKPSSSNSKRKQPLRNPLAPPPRTDDRSKLLHPTLLRRFQFKSIPDGLPTDHPRAGYRFMEVFDSIKLVTEPLFKVMMSFGQLNSATGQSMTCIIADGSLSFLIDVGDELGISVIHFRTISACSFWAYFCIQDMIETGDLPIKDLEGLVLSHIRTKCPKTYTIGPLHAILKSKLESKTTLLQSLSPNSLFEVEKSCMVWLNAQPLKSVIYVSFGNIMVMTKDKLMEFWYGLVNSKKRFLWAIRPNLVTQKDGEGQIPLELVEGTKDQGYMVGWVPQEEVLAHQAISGFLTHSGWNSTLECIVAGVPMICWPYVADQQTNSRFVSEVWKLGMDMKDVCDRVMVEKMVNHLMGERREIFMKSAVEMARLAKESVSEGGSSYCNLDHLIKDIRLMSMITKK